MPLKVYHSKYTWSRCRGKRYRHSRRMRNPQFCVSGKRLDLLNIAHYLNDDRWAQREFSHSSYTWQLAQWLTFHNRRSKQWLYRHKSHHDRCIYLFLSYKVSRYNSDIIVKCEYLILLFANKSVPVWIVITNVHSWYNNTDGQMIVHTFLVFYFSYFYCCMFFIKDGVEFIVLCQTATSRDKSNHKMLLFDKWQLRKNVLWLYSQKPN